MKRLTVIVVAILAVGPQLAAAQGLADVARAEEARRKSVKKPAKTYTNVDLKPDFTTPTTAVMPPSSMTGEPGTTPTPGAAVVNIALSPDPGYATPTAGAQSAEQGWRDRMSGARSTLERSRMFAEALQSRINALTTDVVNRDDPYQRATLEQDRQKALAELARVNKEMEAQTQAISAIEEEARRAGIPPGWLR